jgi:hypothetical protein
MLNIADVIIEVEMQYWRANTIKKYVLNKSKNKTIVHFQIVLHTAGHTELTR